jgi:hypothetical protein
MHGSDRVPDLSGLQASLGWYGSSSTRTKWRALPSARIRTLQKCLTPPTLSERRCLRQLSKSRDGGGGRDSRKEETIPGVIGHWKTSRVSGDRHDPDVRRDTSNKLSAALGGVCRRDDKLHAFQSPSSDTWRLRGNPIDDLYCTYSARPEAYSRHRAGFIIGNPDLRRTTCIVCTSI